jgi:hypothetical protein
MDFKFGVWCEEQQLTQETKAWLEQNRVTSFPALGGLTADLIPVGRAGVADLGEKAKILGGIKKFAHTQTGR